MKRLTDTELVETYFKAKQAKCSEEFLLLLLAEMKRRGISLQLMPQV